MVRDRQFWSWAKISLPKDQREDAISRLMDRLFAEGLLDEDFRRAAVLARVDETIARQIELMPAAFRALHARRGAEMRRRLRLMVTARRRFYLAAVRGRPQRGGASQRGPASGRGAHFAAQQQQQQQQQQEEEEEDEQMNEETGPMDVDTPAPQTTHEDSEEQPTRAELIQQYCQSLSPPKQLLNLPPWPRTPDENDSPPPGPVKDSPWSPAESFCAHESSRQTPRSPTSGRGSPVPVEQSPHEDSGDEDPPIELFSPNYEPPTAPAHDSDSSLELPPAAIQGPTEPSSLQDETGESQLEALDEAHRAMIEAEQIRPPWEQELGTPPGDGDDDEQFEIPTEPVSSQEDAIRKDFDPDENYDNSSEETRGEAPEAGEIEETHLEKPQEHPDDLVDYNPEEYAAEERRFWAEQREMEAERRQLAAEQLSQQQPSQHEHESSASLSSTEKATSSEGSLDGEQSEEDRGIRGVDVAFYDPPALSTPNRSLHSRTIWTAPEPDLNTSNSFPNNRVVVYASELDSSNRYEFLLHQIAPPLPDPQAPDRVLIESLRFDLLQDLLRPQNYDPDRDEIYYLNNRLRETARVVVNSDRALQTALLLMLIHRSPNEFYVRQRDPEQ